MADDNPLPGFLADIRAKARRIAKEFNPDDDPGKLSATTILALAWIDEVNARWDDGREHCRDPETRAALDLAIEIAKEKHNMVATDQNHRQITALGAPVFERLHRIDQDRRTPYDPWQDRHVVSLQAMLGGARPLWGHYIDLASRTLAKK